MTILAQTVQNLLVQADPNRLADLLRRVNVGQLLSDLSAMTVETFDVDASLQCTLSKTPISPVVVMYTESTNNVPLTQAPQGETLGTTEFSVDLTSRVLTAGGTVSSGEELTVMYLGLTAGTAASALAETLAEDFEL